HDPASGQEAAARFAALGPDLQPLLIGAAGSSPYLKGLMAREADWLEAALSQAPERALAEELARLAPIELAGLPDALRQAKRRIALLAGLADLGGVWPLEAVTGALTDLADL